MLNRQATILALLLRARKPLDLVVFVKLAFLLRHETELKDDKTFYDFVPYKFGPFSFALYHDMNSLQTSGFVTHSDDTIALLENKTSAVKRMADDLPYSVGSAVFDVVKKYGSLSQAELVEDVYSRFPWYATKSEWTHLRPKDIKKPTAKSAVVYTAGYEGRSIDAFLNVLLNAGIEHIIDVRANPVSRIYGFSKNQMETIAKKLGLDYRNIPSLGIPSSYRTALSDFESYQKLLDQYEKEMLPKVTAEMVEAGSMMKQKPAVLVCLEKDVNCCHRGRLAKAISHRTGMEVKHL